MSTTPERRMAQAHRLYHLLANMPDHRAYLGPYVPTPTTPVEDDDVIFVCESAASTERNHNDSVNSKQLICAVCLDTPFGNRPTATYCGHVFCGPCIVTSIKQSTKCPVCRKPLNDTKLVRLHI